MNYKELIIYALIVSLLPFGIKAEGFTNKIDKAKFGLAQSLINTSDFKQALPIIEQLYKKYPDNKDIKLWLARLLSWDKQYEQSLKLYSELISEYSDWYVPAREKARVLGWDRQYNEAINEYRKLVDKNPSAVQLRYEMMAKYDLYNQLYISAINDYKKWLSVEPENIEALYDLAQVYSTQNMWANAKNMYQLTLEQYNDHFRALQALKKVDIYSKLIQLKAGFEYFQADSSSRTMDKRYWNTFSSLKKPLNSNTYLSLRQDNIWYSFNDFKQIYQQKFGLTLDYYQKPYFWASANYSSSIYGRNKGVKNLFGGEINLVPIDKWTFTLSHQRTQISDNSTVFLNKLYSDNYKIRCLYKPYRRLMAGFDYMYSDYSDNNIKNTYGIDVGYYLRLEPKSLKLTYRYERYGFSKDEPDYFSPNSFHSNKLGVEWRQFLNKDELFWGANNTYYTLRYEIIFDVKQQVGHKIYADFHHDWNNRCRSGIECSKTIYEHSDIYSEDRFMFYTSLYF